MRTKLLAALLLLTTLTTSAYTKEIKIDVDDAVVINESISDASVDKAIEKLIKLDDKRTRKSKKIYIVINSGGGSIMAGNRLIRFANTIDNVHTICMFCASMAHTIAQAVKGTRYAIPDNIMMAHRARGGFQGQFEDGELESRLALFKKIVRSMEQRNADRIGVSLKFYKEKVRNEWWSYAEDSVKQNIVDEIVELKCSKKLIKSKVPSTIQTPFGTLKGPERSECPLI